MNNYDKVKDMLREEKVPQELEPENIKAMLEAKAPAKKRSRIKMAGRITAGAAACAVLCGTAVHFAGESDIFKKDKSVIDSDYEQMTKQGSTISASNDDTPVLVEQAPYMSGASDYSEVYQLFNNSYKTYEKKLSEQRRYEKVEYNDAIAEEAEDNGVDFSNDEHYLTQKSETPHTDDPTAPAAELGGVDPESVGGPSEPDEEEEHSETYNQEEGVLEADITKTDGKYIYNIYGGINKMIYGDSDDSGKYLSVAAVENGKFTSSEKIEIEASPEKMFGDGYDLQSFTVSDMYLYNDTIAVIGYMTAESVDGTRMTYDGEIADDECDIEETYVQHSYKTATFVNLYTSGESPQLIDTYYQEGTYNDVRIAPDGFMYLLTDYSTVDFSLVKETNCSDYIPSRGTSDDIELIPAEDILMPVDDIEDSEMFTYTLIGSLDMNDTSCAVPADIKALAGYTGNVYCSADNIYTSVGWDDTDITRIAVEEGTITPAASGTVEGRVKDQFSFSEYNGYLRVATTKDTYERREVPVYDDDDDGDMYVIEESMPEMEYYAYKNKRDNRLYVLDMDMDVVGSVTDFGLDEDIKSVNYNGDIAYVVTYEQTDPLFAIDISDPANPVILDEFKLPGYSTYMQKWDDGMLFGFGVDANENGRETGLKLNMFDNSDPDDLKLIDAYEIEDKYTDVYNPEVLNATVDEEWYYSLGCYERKALLIAPEKNLIGIQMCIDKETYDIVDGDFCNWNNEYETGYWFFSFEDGKFVLKGKYTEKMEDAYDLSCPIYERALYIGDYVYLVANGKYTALSMDDFAVTDTVEF